MLKGFCDGAFRDFMEGDAFEIGLLVCVFEHLVQMPRNGFPFAVGVGGKIDFLDRLCGLLEVGKVLSASFGLFVLRNESVFDIDAERAFRQISDVTVRGLDDIVFPEDFSDGLGLCWRLNDHEFIRHLRASPCSLFAKYTSY